MFLFGRPIGFQAGHFVFDHVCFKQPLLLFGEQQHQFAAGAVDAYADIGLVGPRFDRIIVDFCIGHDGSVHDSTYENAQARERTQILMDIANQTGGIVVGTGDLSELALGWATYNGDHISMYGVNAGIPKTLVRHLVRWAAENSFADEKAGGCARSAKDILMDIIDTPISPELLPADGDGRISQVTEDLVGPYEQRYFS